MAQSNFRRRSLPLACVSQNFDKFQTEKVWNLNKIKKYVSLLSTKTPRIVKKSDEKKKLFPAQKLFVSFELCTLGPLSSKSNLNSTSIWKVSPVRLRQLKQHRFITDFLHETSLNKADANPPLRQEISHLIYLYIWLYQTIKIVPNFAETILKGFKNLVVRQR